MTGIIINKRLEKLEAALQVDGWTTQTIFYDSQTGEALTPKREGCQVYLWLPIKEDQNPEDYRRGILP